MIILRRSLLLNWLRLMVSTSQWDRQPMIWLKDGSPSGELTTAPADRRITRNMVFRNSFRGPTSNKWCLDKDDGSSNYEEEGNVLLYGAIKDRDGLWRKAHGNLLVFPELMPFEDTTNTKMAMACVVAPHSCVSHKQSQAVTGLRCALDWLPSIGVHFNHNCLCSAATRSMGWPTTFSSTTL